MRHLNTVIFVLIIAQPMLTGCGTETAADKKASTQPVENQQLATSQNEAAMTDTAIIEKPVALEKAAESQANIVGNETKAAPKANKKASRSLPSIHTNPAGYPSGYVSRKNTVLQNEPKMNALKIADLTLYEGVLILETKRSDENGKVFDVPQWYKVELSNKKQGWVVGRSVTMN